MLSPLAHIHPAARIAPGVTIEPFTTIAADVEIGEGTHTVLMEKNRMQLFQAVQQFLDEDVKRND